MIAPDTNLLLCAYNPSDPRHQAAKIWLQQLLSGDEPVGFPVTVIHSFVRLLTNPAIAGTIITLADALNIVDEWLSLPHVSVLHPEDLHWNLLMRLASDGHAVGNLFPDAAIAAIAQEHNAIIHTNDSDFARFPDLRWHNPLRP